MKENWASFVGLREGGKKGGIPGKGLGRQIKVKSEAKKRYIKEPLTQKGRFEGGVGSCHIGREAASTEPPLPKVERNKGLVRRGDKKKKTFP